MYFKPIAEEYRQQLQKSLDEICDETNEFKSKTDFKLKPIEVGEVKSSKFDMSDNWFLLGEVESNEREADNLVRRCDEKRYDGPIFIADDEYYITVVKENLTGGLVNLKFLCNKPVIPTGVVFKLKDLVQFMDNTKFEFSFPLVTNYKIDMYSQQQNGFYEYSTDYRTISLDEVFEDIVEVKLGSVKMSNTKIIEGKNVPIQNFGKGNKAVIKSCGNSIQLDVVNNGTAVQDIQKIMPINLKKPLQVIYHKSERSEFNPDNFISKIKIRSKKKGNVIVNGFELDYIVKYLDKKNREDADKINDNLLKSYSSRKSQNIYKALDSSQKSFLNHFVDDSLNQLNINEAINNCIDYCIEKDILNPNTHFVRPRNIYDCLSPDPKVYDLRVKQLVKKK